MFSITSIPIKSKAFLITLHVASTKTSLAFINSLSSKFNIKFQLYILLLKMVLTPLQPCEL